MAAPNPLMCKKCNIPMNHHAEKQDQSTGEVLEIHTCPGCGSIDSRVQKPE